MHLTDTHCHLDLDKFDSDRQAVLERAVLAGVEHILIPGLSLLSSRAVLKLAQSHPMLHAAIGVHPTEAESWGEETYNELKALATESSDTAGTFGKSGTSYTSNPFSSSKVLAIGEIGLDYYWDSAAHDIQRYVLRQQLELATGLGVPVILHMREAGDAPQGACAADLLKILAEWCAGLRSGRSPLAGRPGVMHSFSGTLETARAAMDLGFFIGVTGPITFTNAARKQEIVTALPLERILIETDAPFQTPYPLRGKRNEPACVRLIADKIAILLACTLDMVATTTSENARRLFAWKENS